MRDLLFGDVPLAEWAGISPGEPWSTFRAAVIWDVPDPTVGPLIDRVLLAGTPVLALAGVWDGARPPLTPGLARVSLLVTDGLHFGQAPLDALMGEPTAGPVFAAGLDLMRELTSR